MLIFLYLVVNKVNISVWTNCKDMSVLNGKIIVFDINEGWCYNTIVFCDIKSRLI
jgi:hypothetical protein